MKKYYFLIIILIAMQANAQKNIVKPADNTTIKLKSAADSLQYILGSYVGLFLVGNGFTTINGPFFQAGMEDVYNNRKRQIPDSLQIPIMDAYRANFAKQRGKLLETQLFNALKDKEGVGKLPSGVQYMIVKKGSGPRPSETDSVILHYKGMLADGTVFEDSHLNNTPILALPSSFIPGVSECLQLMTPGSIWDLYIPSSQAYGDKGNGKAIPPNSALKITIELLQVRRR